MLLEKPDIVEMSEKRRHNSEKTLAKNIFPKNYESTTPFCGKAFTSRQQVLIQIFLFLQLLTKFNHIFHSRPMKTS